VLRTFRVGAFLPQKMHVGHVALDLWSFTNSLGDWSFGPTGSEDQSDWHLSCSLAGSGGPLRCGLTSCGGAWCGRRWYSWAFHPSLARRESPLRVSSPVQGEGKPRLEFSASEILDPEFDALLSGRRNPSHHQVEFKIYTPAGHLYQVLTSDLTPAPSTRARSPRREQGHRKLTARLPVAGTSIVTSSLYGKWTVVAPLDGEGKPASVPRRFTITH
jgi:hypothetical protein